jgi:MCRA family/Alcohol dehydrogenase GroES-like domain
MIQDAMEETRPDAKPIGLTMRAVEYVQYGDTEVLHMADHRVPQRLRGQLMIEVLASSVNPIDYRIRRGEMKFLIPFGFPRVPGYDVAGIVAESDSDSAFAVGDRVMAFLDSTRGGALADYAVCSDSVAARIPDSMSMQDAAAIPLAGTTALQSLRDHGKIKRGQTVLVNGASGGVGMFAVQIAKYYGCHVDAIASGRINWRRNGIEGGVNLGPDDLVFITIGSLTENSDNGDHHTPAKLNVGPAPAWDLWRRIAAKDPAFGRPNVFGSNIPETKWESATVTTLDDRIPKYIQKIARRDPFSGKVVTGGIVTAKDSSWLLSWTVNRQPHFKQQPKDQIVVWVYSLFVEKPGD